VNAFEESEAQTRQRLAATIMTKGSEKTAATDSAGAFLFWGTNLVPIISM
jgi:hypothetical protein